MLRVIIGDTHKIEYIQDKLKPLNNKLAEMGSTPITFKRVGTSFKHTRINGKKFQYQEMVYILEGSVPKIDGHEYLGKIEHYEAGNIIFQSDDSVNLESFRHGTGVCVHCNTRRQRKFTHLLASPEGELKQVGSNCLADFLRDDNYLKMLEFFADLEPRGGSEDGGYGRIGRYFYTDELVTRVTRYMLSAGVTVNKDITALLMEYLLYSYGLKTFSGRDAHIQKMEFLEECSIFERPVSGEVYEATLAAVEARLAEGPDHFTRNLRILRTEKTLPYKKLKLAMWMVLSYFKDLTWEQDKKKREEQYAQEKLERQQLLAKQVYGGAVGEVLTDVQLQVTEKKYMDSNWGGFYILTLVNAAGVRFQVSGNSKLVVELELGGTYKVTATIKELKEWNGFKSTKLRLKKVTK